MSTICDAISFYHIASKDYLSTLFLLLKKTLDQEKRALVLFEEEDQLDRAGKFLWEGHAHDFIPHGKIKDPFPEKQPVFLTDSLYNPNNASFLFMTPKIDIMPPNEYERCFILFSNHNNEDIQWARGLWSAAKAERKNPQYWFQDAQGQWTLK